MGLVKARRGLKTGQIIRNELLDLVLEARSSGSIDKMEKVAIISRDLSRSEKIAFLEDLAKDLEIAIESFDIEKMDNILNEFIDLSDPYNNEEKDEGGDNVC